ncbi:MDR family MFS transporter [Pseudonocardia acaciae]|uniref:MDR family MFS transporter n=1 Tax=Pseudonocardia acaciae TaxID=551276 RepID=UPI0006880839|nr:MDR family MFS transporter [Pseudonocardia acaciae]
MTNQTTRQPLDRRLLRIGAVLLAAPVMANIDATSVGVATDTLAESFDAPLSAVQWVAAGYLLAVAMVIPAAGWASDRFGGKRVWMFAVTLFTAGSLLCGLAWSLPSLIVFRLVEAVGGGLMNPVGQAILARAAGRDRIGRLMSLVSIPVAFGPALGPVLGGVLVHEFGWRAIFFVNLPVCLVLLPIAARLLPAERDARDRGQRLDLMGLALLSPGIAAAVYGFTSLGGGGGAPLVAGSLGVALLLVAGYVVHALRGAGTPLIDLRLFTRGGFAAATGTAFLLGASLYSSMLLVPLYYQQVQGANALTAGLLLTPQAVGAAAGAFVAGRFTDRYGPKYVLLAGIVLAMAGTVVFTQVTASPPGWLLVCSLAVRGLGLGAVMGPNLAAAYSSVEKHEASRASSAYTVMHRVGGSLGTAILTVVLQQSLAGAPPGPASSAGFGHTFWWALALCVLALVPAAFFPARRATAKP